MKQATEIGSLGLGRGMLTSVLSAKAFSPHETHYCLLGSGVCLKVEGVVSHYCAPRTAVAWYWTAVVC